VAVKPTEQVAMTPLPFYQMACVLFIQICEGLNVNVLFPFVAFMVEDMGYTGAELGYHAGLMAAAFCFAQFCTAVPWGMISDNYGRKPTIIIGTIGAGMGMVLFGMSRTFPQAVAARALSGLLNGNLGVVKSLLTEITDDTNRGAAFSYMSLAWAIGTVIAPLAGGMLCKPAEKYPSVFPDKSGSLFAEYPYLLPCLLCACWSFFSATFCLFFMVETRFTKRNSKFTLSKNGSKDNLNEISQKSIEMTKMGRAFDSMSSLNTKVGYSAVQGNNNMTDYDDEESQCTVPMYSTRSPMANPGEEQLSDLEFSASSHSPNKFSNMQTQLQQALKNDVNPTLSNHETISPLSIGSPTVPDALKVSPGAFSIGGEESSSSDEEHQPQKKTSNNNKQARRYGDGKQGYSAVSSGSNSGGSSKNFDALKMDRASDNHTYIQDKLDNNLDNNHDNEEEEEEEEDEDEEEEEEMCCSCFSSPVDAGSSGGSGMDSSSHNLKENSFSGKNGQLNGRTEGPRKKYSTAAVLRQRVVVLATSNYGMLCAASILLEETLPLFLKETVNAGGFGFDSMHIGFLLSISGCVMLVFTSVVLPGLSRHSKFWMFRVGTIGCVPVALSLPFIALLNRVWWSSFSPSVHYVVLWTVLPIVNVLKSVFTCFAFSAVMIQVNHSVYDEYLGAVNGLGQSLAALARAVGPALGGALWSVSTRHHFVYLNFIVAALSFLFCLYLNQLLPASIDFKKKRPLKNKSFYSEDPDEENAGIGAGPVACD